MLVFFRFLKVLEGLGSSGMLVARISIGFHFNPPQDRAPTRPKIAPRRVQDRLGALFLSLEFSLRFLIVWGSVLVPFWPPKWSPGSAWIVGNPAPGRPKTVLGSSWIGPFFVLQLGFAFLILLGSSWGRFGSLLASPSWALLGAFLGRPGLSWARFWALRMAFRSPITLNSHQLLPFNPWPVSTLQPGPADCALALFFFSVFRFLSLHPDPRGLMCCLAKKSASIRVCLAEPETAKL